MGSIKYFAKSISEVSESSRWFATGGDIHFDAIKEVAVQSTDKVRYEPYAAPADDEAEFEVEIVKNRTALDEGYDEKGETLVDGLIFGKTYVYEAWLFRNGKIPADFETIRWAYSYESEQGRVEGVFEGKTGKKLTISIEALNVCGRNLTIYAYISNKERGGGNETWVHYRFRYFSRKVIQENLDRRIATNALINQSTTSLCGMAAIFYAFLRKAPGDYSKIAYDLHRRGECTLNNYTIKPAKIMYDMQPTLENEDYPGERTDRNGHDLKFPKLMDQLDWIILASTRSSESNFGYSGKNSETASAINWGSVMEPLMKDLMGYTVFDHTAVINRGDFPATMKTMQKEYNEGYQIIMLINVNMLYHKERILNISDWHYIVFEGDLHIENDYSAYIFSYYSWGELNKNKKFTASVFNSTFHGYYKIKK